MGTVTKLQISNLALSMVGSANITTFGETTTEEGKRITAVYDYVRDEVLQEHPWTFAQKRTVLAGAITGITAANPPVVTSAAHGFSDEDKIYIESVDGMTQVNGNDYYVANKTADTFELQSAVGTDVDGSEYTAYDTGDSSGYVTKYADIVMDDDNAKFEYSLPSDFIRSNVFSVNPNDMYLTFEGDKLFADTPSLKMIYTYRNDDPLLYTSQFVTALATRIAAEICFNLTQSVNKAKDFRTVYETIALPRAMGADSSQGSPEELDVTQWEESRL